MLGDLNEKSDIYIYTPADILYIHLELSRQAVV